MTRLIDSDIDVNVVLDAYSGVGLFARCIGSAFDASVVTIESDGSCVNDAKVNLADIESRIILGEVAAVRPDDVPRPDVIIADPSRTGLGPSAARSLAALGATQIILASCDPASFARDSTLLDGLGYSLNSAHVLDLFPQTFHCEVVGSFRQR